MELSESSRSLTPLQDASGGHKSHFHIGESVRGGTSYIESGLRVSEGREPCDALRRLAGVRTEAALLAKSCTQSSQFGVQRYVPIIGLGVGVGGQNMWNSAMEGGWRRGRPSTEDDFGRSSNTPQGRTTSQSP